MFIQHNECFINKSNVNFIKVNENALKLYLYFGATGEGVGGGMITLKCDDEAELEGLIEKLIK